MRMGLLCGAMALALGGLIASAWRVQVEDGAAWRELAERQRQRRLHIEPKRGSIYDRNGTPLAVSVDVPSISADVVEMLRGVDDPARQEARLHEIADALAKVLSLDAGEIYGKLTSRRRFVWIKRRVTADEVQAVRNVADAKGAEPSVRGLTIEGEGHRYYPGRELAGPLLGFVSPDGHGKDGIELGLDEDLRGKVEDVHGVRDRSGRLIFDGITEERALQGNDVVLTIDEGIQHTAERELDAAMHTYETKGGSLVVVDPSTGEILALASVPGYNPNDYTDSEVDARRNRVVADRFEPGSVMKPFMIAGALAAGAINATDSIYCEHGVYSVGGITVHDTHLNDLLTPTQILAKSSNIGALKIGLTMGESALYATYRRFGFGELSGVDIPGEASGLLRPKGRPWYDAETASASFGQGIMVTTLQLAMAMGAVANGGKLLEPILVKKVTDGAGVVVRESSVQLRRQVAPTGVARTVADMLTAVTEEGGTAVEAAIPGFRVAGKTSTAQKVDPATGKYSSDKYTAVFVGFVPVEHPRLVAAVVLDEPMVGRYGGDLAGPVFRRVGEAALRALGVTPSAGAVSLSAPPHENPPTGSKLPIAADSPSTDPPAGSVRVPDATGLAAHDVFLAISKAGLVPRIEGWGRVVRQTPPAGAPASKGSQVLLVLEPAS
jgi:cell division protein FtsI (penicillin-binding protein 3)